MWHGDNVNLRAAKTCCVLCCRMILDSSLGGFFAVQNGRRWLCFFCWECEKKKKPRDGDFVFIKLNYGGEESCAYRTSPPEKVMPTWSQSQCVLWKVQKKQHLTQGKKLEQQKHHLKALFPFPLLSSWLTHDTHCWWQSRLEKQLLTFYHLRVVYM